MYCGTSAGPLPSRPAWRCGRLNAARSVVPSGDRLGSPAFSAARLGEGLTHSQTPASSTLWPRHIAIKCSMQNNTIKVPEITSGR
jgi:hypothetical protein